MLRTWKKPVVVFYRERKSPRVREALAVVKARQMTVAGESEKGPFTGTLEAFFPMMGELDCLSSPEGQADRYVFCWPDDAEDNEGKAWKRLTGVAFVRELRCTLDANDKPSYSAEFTARKGKLD